MIFCSNSVEYSYTKHLVLVDTILDRKEKLLITTKEHFLHRTFAKKAVINCILMHCSRISLISLDSDTCKAILFLPNGKPFFSFKVSYKATKDLWGDIGLNKINSSVIYSKEGKIEFNDLVFKVKLKTILETYIKE